jgi:hypothetical protein
MVALHFAPPQRIAKALSIQELQMPISQISLFEDLLKLIENISISLLAAMHTGSRDEGVKITVGPDTIDCDDG